MKRTAWVGVWGCVLGVMAADSARADCEDYDFRYFTEEFFVQARAENNLYEFSEGGSRYTLELTAEITDDWIMATAEGCTPTVLVWVEEHRVTCVAPSSAAVRARAEAYDTHASLAGSEATYEALTVAPPLPGVQHPRFLLALLGSSAPTGELTVNVKTQAKVIGTGAGADCIGDIGADGPPVLYYDPTL